MTTPLHLVHASMQFSDTAKQKRADLAFTLGLGADAVSLTEIGGTQDILLAREVCGAAGYRLHHPGRGGECIALRRGLPILDSWKVLVHPPEGWESGHHPHAARFVVGLQFLWQTNRVWLFNAHWLTDFSARPTEHMAMTEAMIEAVEGHARGRALAFFAGDVNIDEATDLGSDPRKPHHLFGRAGLTSVWDELGVTPGTHGPRTIDVIGSYDRDRRVSAASVRVYRGRNSDHRPIAARYRVAP